MAVYNYTAYKSNIMKAIESGRIEADNIIDARSQLKQRGLIPTNLTVVGGDNKSALKDMIEERKKKAKNVLQK